MKSVGLARKGLGGVQEAAVQGAEPVPVAIPEYLERVYWWAYLHPRGLQIFDHPLVVNLILWGNYRRLGNEVLAEFQANAQMRVLQLACVYGDFSQRLAVHLGPYGQLDVVDVAKVQLENLRGKANHLGNLRLHHQNAAELTFTDAAFDHVVVFFLLHEQPAAVRRASLAEALRVLKPGGHLILVDYHLPAGWSPLRYFMYPVLRWLEPFALDLWRHELDHWLPAERELDARAKTTFGGGLYQKRVFRKLA
ncbi:MAG: rhodoquinone biosynthesis methyltransferase RquA [Thiotrichales bacterium]